MIPKSETTSTVVDLGSSDEEDGSIRVENRNNVTAEQPLHTGTGMEIHSPETIPQSSTSHQNPVIESRSFWRAGAYDVGPTKSAPAQGQLEHARVHPKFLHSNATSHKWAFGAIAELLDNAVDEICNGATFVKVDKICNIKDNSPALLFQDDGGGMDPKSMRQCMSLGYSSKKANTTIGQYGNGFKTSTMRLGADVIVFSRATRASYATQSIGLLSYTFLRRTGQDDVIVPMVDFELSENRADPIIYGSQDDWDNNLKTILGWSPFASKEELMLQFEDIGPHGTKVIIYNLWLNDDGALELDFDDDAEDIRLRDEATDKSTSKAHNKLVESHISYLFRFSLREYASILYLKKFKNFHIILRGRHVQQFSIADMLKYSKVIMYRPQLGMTSKEVSVETTVGFIKEAPGLSVSGFNIYHKNRLIRPFWRVFSEGSSRGHGVVGVLEANFIEPAHDKQDFERSSLFIRLEMRLKQIILEYWRNHCHLIGLQTPGANRQSTQKKFHADQASIGLAPNSENELSTDQHVIGLSAHVQREMYSDQAVIGLSANSSEELSNSQPGISFTSNFPKDLPTVQPIIGLAAGSFKGAATVDSSGSTLADQICEENIQLFMRCEEHIQRESELKQTIEELEKELEETKRKCSQLSAHLEMQKQKKIMKPQTKV